MGVVFEMAALKVLSSAAVLLFGTVLLMATARRISTCAWLFAFQSLVLAGEVASVAYIQHSREAWLVAGMVFVVKVLKIVIFPHLNLQLKQKWNVFLSQYM